MIYILISIAAGVTIVIARILNSHLANKIGIFPGTLINFIVGLLFSTIFLFISNEGLNISSSILKSIPFWAYLGGFVGVIVIALSNFVTPKISAFYLTLIVFSGQLFTGMLIDYFSLGIISIGKIIGGLLVVSGLGYNLLVDKKQLRKDEKKLAA